MTDKQVINDVNESDDIEAVVGKFFDDEGQIKEEEVKDDDDKQDMPSEEVQDKKDEEEDEDSSQDSEDAQEEEETTEDSEDDQDEATEDSEEEKDSPDKDNQDEVKLPRNMPADLKAAIEKMETDEAKQEALKVFKSMEANHTRKSQELSAQRKFAENVNEVFYKFNSKGLKNKDKVRIIDQYAQFDIMFNRDPKEAIKLLIKSQKIDASELIDEKDNEFLTDSQKAERKEIEALKQKINNLEANKSQENYSKIQNEIEDFKNTKEEDGSLKYPYFDKLQDSMAKLAKFEDQKNLSLEVLYKKALRLDDELSMEQEKSKIKKALDKKEKERKERLKKAKRIKKSTISSKQMNTKKTDYEALLRQDAERIFNAINK